MKMRNQVILSGQSHIRSLVLSSTIAATAISALGQSAQVNTDGTAQPPSTIPTIPATQTTAGGVDISDNTTYASGKPLQGESKEGFWGHLNPFARKRWVNRQVDPIKDRANELDQLEAKNATEIRDVDSRSQAGVNHALTSANTADQHAADAQNRADTAQGVATDASNRTRSLNATVSSLDQYQVVSSSPVTFAAGRTTLGPKAKAQLDEVAAKLANEKGYLIEVQGYSRGGIQPSQEMADSVVRYLVTEHQVPLYRIYRTGLGSSTQKPAEGGPTVTNGVMVNLMHNSLATMSSNSALGTASGTANPTSNSPIGTSSSSSTQ